MNRAIWFTGRPPSVLSGVVAACQPPFWQRDASGGGDTRELEKPAAHFRADNAVIDKLCGTGGGARIDTRPAETSFAIEILLVSSSLGIFISKYVSSICCIP